MTDHEPDHLVILAGGQSRRMGRDKALVEIQEKRMIDHMVDRFQSDGLRIVLSATQDYGTGLKYIPDDPNAPAGPVGAIFTLADQFLSQKQPVAGFYTIPVDAPRAPLDLRERLKNPDSCAVAEANGQLHPVFAYWRCSIVKSVRDAHDPSSRAPSLHWLVRQCDSELVHWDDDAGFANINTPVDLDSFNRE